MKLSLNTFFKSIFIYALLTCPSMLIPIIYALSIFYAATFGWIAWLFFYIILSVCSTVVIAPVIKWIALVFAIIGGVLCGYIIIGYQFYDIKVWEDDSFILFPLIAIVSGFIGTLFNRKKIISYINTINHEEKIESIPV